MAIRPEPRTLGGLPVQIDYTARDYTSIRDELIRHIDSIMPNWTDRSPSDIGVSMLEAMAYLGDILSYNLDRVHNESYLATAQTEQAVSYILRLIGYSLAPPSPATVSIVVSTNLNNVVLPQGFVVSTSDESGETLEYQLKEDVLLPSAGRYAVSYDVSDAIRIYDDPLVITDDRLLFVAGRSITEDLAVSTGEPDQAYITSQGPACMSSDSSSPIRLFIGGVEWEGRTTFVGTESTSSVYVYRFLVDGGILITFGDGVLGAIPTISEIITVTYRINGGEDTNRAGVGTITSFSGVVGVESVYNINQPSGGTDRETLDHARKHGPLSLRAMDRCVTLQDFETMAINTPGGGIRTARAVRGISSIDVNVYVATEGVNPVPSGFWFSNLNSGYGTIGAVGRFLNLKKPIPTRLNVLAPTMVEVYVKANIYVYANVLRSTSEEEVDLALQRLFNSITDEFGQGLPLSAVHQAIENTRGVDYVDIVEMHKIPSIYVINGSQDALNTAIVSIFDLGQRVVAQAYEIIWLSTDEFKLKASKTGVIVDNLGIEQVFNRTETSSVYIYPANTPDNPDQELQFRLNFSFNQDLPNRSNIWGFSVDKFVGNITCEEHEILASPIQGDLRLSPSNINLSFLGGI